jgi:hypothetical protein
MMASEDEAVTLDAETIRHDGKPAETAEPREGTGLAMTTALNVAVTRTSIAPLAATMTKGRAPAAMTMIHLHEEQKEAPMAAAVVVEDQQGHATLAGIRRTSCPTTLVPI